MEEKDYINDNSFKNGYNPFGSPIVGIILLVLVVFGGLGALFFFYIKPNFIDEENIYVPQDPINENNNETKEQVEIILDLNKLQGLKKDDTSSYTNTYDLYYNKGSHEEYYTCGAKDKCSDKITVKVSSKNIYRLNNYKDKYLYYIDDDTFKIYDVASKEVYIVNNEFVRITKDNNKLVYVIENDNTDELLGLVYAPDESSNKSFFSFRLNKFIYETQYESIEFLTANYLKGHEVCNDCYVKESIHIIDATKENIVKKFDLTDDLIQSNFNIKTLKNNYNSTSYIYESTFDENMNEQITKIYNSNLEEIASNTNEYNVSVNKDGNLYVLDGTVVTAYDKNGKVLRTNNDYNVVMLIDDYIVALKNGKLILATIDGKEEELGDYKNVNKDISKYKLGVVEPYPGIYTIYVALNDEMKAYYYVPATGEVGTTKVTSRK